MKRLNKNKIIYSAILLTALSPFIAFATNGLQDFIGSIDGILRSLGIPLVTGVAIIYFFWGVGQFILHSDEEKVREDGKQKMLWGVIALFVIFSILGILSFIKELLGLPDIEVINSSIIY